MWIKLTGEYVNLDHIVRVKVSKSFKNGQEDYVLDLEGIIKGELQYFTRYRGIDAEVVLQALNLQSRIEPGTVVVGAGAPQEQVTRNTLHDVQI